MFGLAAVLIHISDISLFTIHGYVRITSGSLEIFSVLVLNK
jgi:hypothetical protein